MIKSLTKFFWEQPIFSYLNGKASFLIMVVISSTIYFFQRFEISIPEWVNNYINDLFCMPIVLSICLFVLRKFKGKQASTLPLWMILCLSAYFAFYFEYHLPKVTDRYTSDILDVLLYFLGSMLFYLYTRLKLKQQ